MYESFNYSVVIPYHDRHILLLKAVDSIPDRDDIQIILVDNSTCPLQDDSIPKKQKALVTYATSSSTRGAGCARNTGLKYVKGRFIIFLDADDYFTDNAFFAFDKYLFTEYDIIYFQADSTNLNDGTQSNRHKTINHLVELSINGTNTDYLRYQFVNPVAKMLRTKFVKESGVLFDEIPVSNDVWFSVMTGHLAQRIKADKSIVYMITAGDNGSSLTRRQTKENCFIRFQVMVKVNTFLKSIGKYKYRIRLLGALRFSWKEFGFKSFLEFFSYAREKGAGIL